MNYDSLKLEPLESLPSTISGNGTLVSLTEGRGIYMLDDGMWDRLNEIPSLAIFTNVPKAQTPVCPRLDYNAKFSGYLTLNNFSDADQTVSLFFRKDATSDLLPLLNTVSVSATQSLTIDISSTLPAGSTLFASCSTENTVAICAALTLDETAQSFSTLVSKTGIKVYPNFKGVFKEVILCNMADAGVNPTVSLSVNINGKSLPLISNVAMDDMITLLANFGIPAMEATDYIYLSSSVDNAVAALISLG